MGYSVYIQKFKAGKPAPVPSQEVLAILRRYGPVHSVGSRLEFNPKGDDLCEVAYLGGSEVAGIDSVGFERPGNSDRFRQLIFELLGVEGMCYFELDVTFVLARSDVSAELPKELLALCETGEVTLVPAFADLASKI